MRLSLCLIAGDAPDRVAAALDPWRDLADEVVLGCAPGVEPASLAALGDVVVPLRAGALEADPADLQAACTGDWVLWTDADEVPSPALLAALPAVLEDPAVRQALIPRRWLAPGGAAAWLDELPWWPDLRPRLTRNEPVPTAPRERRDPAVDLAWPTYKLTALLDDRVARQDDGVARDVRIPGQLGTDGRPLAAMYEPEAFATRPAAPVPPEDRPALDAHLRAVGRPPLGPAPPSPPAAPTDPAAQAELVPLEGDPRVLVGVGRRVMFRLTNRTPDTWPGTPADPGSVRVAHGVKRPDGTLVADGGRSAGVVGLAPGASAAVSVWVPAPAASGPLVLEVGAVRDDVEWLRGTGRMALEAVPAPVLPDRRAPVPVAPAPRRRLFSRGGGGAPVAAIPPIVHRVWLGDRPIPEEQVAFGDTWRTHHPGWEHRLWTDADAPVPPSAARARNVGEKADLVRYEILRRHGGIYVDTDVECLRPIDPLLEGVPAFAAYESAGVLCNAVLGTVPGHPAFDRLLALTPRTAGVGSYPAATATHFLTRVFDLYPDIALFGPELFYPYLWDSDRRPASDFPGAYAVHHWAKSWDPEEVA